MQQTRSLFSLGLPLTASLALLAGDVQAATEIRQFRSTPTSLCQTALPAYEVEVRKRPLALQNEGSGDVFVTCALIGQWSQVGEITHVTLSFRSAGNAAATVSCTGVTGTGNAGQTNLYVTKSVSLPNGNAVGWDGNDFDADDGTIPSLYFSVSCKLPPGVGITSTFIQFTEGVGD